MVCFLKPSFRRRTSKRGLISGFINAAAGLGSNLFFPASFQAFPCRRNPDSLCCAQSDHDWNPSLSFLFDAAPKKERIFRKKGPVPEASFSLLLQGALKRPEFRYLLGAFTTCGFHMALIEAHLFLTAALLWSSKGHAPPTPLQPMVCQQSLVR